MKKHKNQKIDETPDETGARAPSPADGAEETPRPTQAAEAQHSSAATEPDEFAALKDRHARLLADFDNYRKRQAREREEWSRRANELLLEDFLPVVDHLELALSNAPNPPDPFAAGVKLVYDQFIAALEKNGVTPLDAKGQPFNPEWHEALSQVPSDTVPEGGVIEQFRRGWLIGGRLMRPAQVIVSAGQQEKGESF